MEFDQIYILNPVYRLKADKKRAVLFNSSNDPIKSKDTSDFLGLVHPIFGILFSFFNGENNLNEAVEKASNFLGLSNSDVLNLVLPLIQNDDELNFNYNGYCLHFPKNLFIKRECCHDSINKIELSDYLIPKSDLDLKSWRLYQPLDILFMVNNICHTDCIYCYADRREKTNLKIPFQRIKELIKEAKSLGMRNVDISGGEIFLYSNWEALLNELAENNFKPYISTKTPIDLETIKKLKSNGVKRIQISLDSIEKCQLSRILNVKDNYYSEIMQTLENLDKNGLIIYINTQITRFNSDKIEELVKYLLGLENVKRINISAAGYSLYSNHKFTDFRTDIETMKNIEEFINKTKDDIGDNVILNVSGYVDGDKYLNVDRKIKENNFKSRSRCSANFYAMFLLPDGKVTVCEELYWHPRFIIGDLTKQSIEEVWNSEKALGLDNLAKTDIRDESECKQCDQFHECHKFLGVCWKEILYAYGYENWDYPDPKCPKAPKPNNIFYL